MQVSDNMRELSVSEVQLVSGGASIFPRYTPISGYLLQGVDTIVNGVDTIVDDVVKVAGKLQQDILHPQSQ